MKSTQFAYARPFIGSGSLGGPGQRLCEDSPPVAECVQVHQNGSESTISTPPSFSVYETQHDDRLGKILLLEFDEILLLLQ